MRTFAQLSLLVSKDADQRLKLFEQLIALDDSGTTSAKTFQASDLTLAASASDVAVAFGGVTNANTLLILAYQEIAVKLNAGGSPGPQQSFRVVPLAATGSANPLSTFQINAQPGVLFIRGKVTSVHLSNPSSGATAEALIILVGEAS